MKLDALKATDAERQQRYCELSRLGRQMRPGSPDSSM
jgi:hypothetical protein